MIVMVLGGTGFGCNWFPLEGDRGLPPWPTSSPEPRPDASRDLTPDGGTAPDADGMSDGYDVMCLHYCKALEETDVLGCAVSGRDVETCVAAAPSAASCFDLRCRPHRVDSQTCLTQCDSLAGFYAGRCPAAGDPSDSLCPSSREDHDTACRAGCVL
jgi:hypothetical protein